VYRGSSGRRHDGNPSGHRCGEQRAASPADESDRICRHFTSRVDSIVVTSTLNQDLPVFVKGVNVISPDGEPLGRTCGELKGGQPAMVRVLQNRFTEAGGRLQLNVADLNPVRNPRFNHTPSRPNRGNPVLGSSRPDRCRPHAAGLMNVEPGRKQEFTQPLLPWDTQHSASSTSTKLPKFGCTLADALEVEVDELAV